MLLRKAVRRCTSCLSTENETRFTNGSKYKCAACACAIAKDYYHKNKLKCRGHTYEWVKRNPEQRKKIRNASNKKARVATKELVIAYYSNGTNACACCGESIVGFLTVDHINNDGAEDRRKSKRYGTQFYWWLKTNDFPPGYRILCYNCNCGRDKDLDKICPHKRVIV